MLIHDVETPESKSFKALDAIAESFDQANQKSSELQRNTVFKVAPSFKQDLHAASKACTGMSALLSKLEIKINTALTKINALEAGIVECDGPQRKKPRKI